MHQHGQCLYEVARLSASNIRGVSRKGVSPGEVLVVVLVVLVVAFFLIVSHY